MRRIWISRISIGLILLSLLTVGISAASLDKAHKPYSVWDKAYYLSPEQIQYVRPGYKLTIVSVTIPDTRKPVVQFKITDANDVPLDRTGVLTPGTASTSWVLSRIKPADKEYTAYTVRTQTSPITGKAAVQASADSGGTYKTIAVGEYEYTFGTTLPADYEKNATTTLGVYGSRNLTTWGLSTYYVNVFKTWVPDGSAVTKVRDVAGTASCNKCHNPLGLHGGSRREMLLCVLCHYTNVIDPDTGNTVDMKVMTHKIHMGKDLPSVIGGKPYQIIGNQQSVNDYSTIGYPFDVRDCDTCHSNATQANNWKLYPTRATCGSCHDDIVWETGQNHGPNGIGGPRPSDTNCAGCHYPEPEGGVEFDTSVSGAHVIPTFSKQLDGYVTQITKVENAAPGKLPKVYFKLNNKKTGASVHPKDMTRTNLSIAGSTEPDYSFQLSERVSGATSTVQVSGDGFVYTFTKPLPADASGTYTFGIEAYNYKTLNPGQASEIKDVRDRAETTFAYIAVTDTTPVPRRAVVSDAKCNACHGYLTAHGGNRNGVQYCATCHRPGLVQTSGSNAGQNWDFRYMVHKIHTGEELARTYAGFEEVLYPGDRRDCLQCHLTGTYEIPLAEGRLSLPTSKDYITVTPPESAACLSCHDSRTASAHAFFGIAPFGEACGACHGPTADFSIAKSHAR
jgi:OmcA/MtrC family decaheme c-type cytochrome